MFAWQQLVGYAASALVVTSLSMTSLLRLRMISLAGSLTFLTYGLLIESVPIVLTNIAITFLNLRFLTREFRGPRDLGAVVVPPESPFLRDFLHHHAADIRQFQPDVDLDEPTGFALMPTRDGLPAGVVLGTRDDTHVTIHLDYVLPAHRDSRLGNWLYGPGATVFRRAGVETITSAGGSDTHRGYLRRVGFTRGARDEWVLAL